MAWSLKKAAPGGSVAAPTLSLAEKGLVMTVPTNPESPHSQVGVSRKGDGAKRSERTRRQGLLVIGVAAVGITVVALVLVFPRLAAPLGTSAGVVAVLVPLIQMLRRGGTSGGGPAGEP